MTEKTVEQKQAELDRHAIKQAQERADAAYYKAEWALIFAVGSMIVAALCVAAQIHTFAAP